VERHFGITRSPLTGDPRWTRFFAAQVKAVMIQKVTRRLGFHLDIRHFAMPAGCVVPQDSQDSITSDFGDITGQSRTYQRICQATTPFRLLNLL
jgi:hypothetical protein